MSGAYNYDCRPVDFWWTFAKPPLHRAVVALDLFNRFSQFIIAVRENRMEPAADAHSSPF